MIDLLFNLIVQGAKLIVIIFVAVMILSWLLNTISGE